MLGSTIALANSSGLATQYSYEPFGATTISGSSSNPFQFTGRENDGTGLYYYRGRYYSPTFGRFISQDPLGLAGGDPNLYGYANQNPISFADPRGLETGWVSLGGPTPGPIEWPDVSVGLDSPVGGVETTFPFGSGGEPTTKTFGPSLNFPLPPIDGNLQVQPQLEPELGLECTLQTPVGGVGGGVNVSNLTVSGPEYSAPQLNFPLAPTVNGYIRFSWSY